VSRFSDLEWKNWDLKMKDFWLKYYLLFELGESVGIPLDEIFLPLWISTLAEEILSAKNVLENVLVCHSEKNSKFGLRLRKAFHVNHEFDFWSYSLLLHFSMFFFPFFFISSFYLYASINSPWVSLFVQVFYIWYLLSSRNFSFRLELISCCYLTVALTVWGSYKLFVICWGKRR